MTRSWLRPIRAAGSAESNSPRVGGARDAVHHALCEPCHGKNHAHAKHRRKQVFKGRALHKYESEWQSTLPGLMQIHGTKL